MKLRKASELTEERNRDRNEKKQREHDEGMEQAIKGIEEAHKARKNRARIVFSLPDSVLEVLNANGYRAERERPDEFAGPGTLPVVNIAWD